MKPTLTLIVGFCLGLAIGIYGTHQYLGDMMLRGLYVGEAASINIYMALLKEQRENNQSKLTEYIERHMHSSATILEGCKNDLCKFSEITEVAQALEKVKKYEYQQFHP